MACDAKGGAMDSVRSTASSAAEGRLKVSLLDRKKKKMGGGAVSGSTNTTLPMLRLKKRAQDEGKGIGI